MNQTVPSPTTPWWSRRRPRLRLRPTPVGLMLLVVLIGLWGGAISYQSNSALLILSLILGVALVSGLHAWGNLRGIQLQATAGPAAFVGDQLTGSLTMIAREHQQHINITAYLMKNGKAVLLLGGLDRVRSGQSGHLPFSLLTQRRGRLEYTQVRLCSIYPFGLCQVSIDLPVRLSWLIYPRPVVEERDLLSCSQDVTPQEGGTAARPQARTEGGEDFSGHRAYLHGDSQHHIDWRAVARGRPLLTKLYAHDHVRPRRIEWSYFDDDDLEHRLGRITGQVVSAEGAGAAFSLLLPHQQFSAGAGPEHYHRCLAALALFAEGAEGVPSAGEEQPA